MASLPSGILVQTAASTVMIAPDCKVIHMAVRTADQGDGLPRPCAGPRTPIWRAQIFPLSTVNVHSVRGRDPGCHTRLQITPGHRLHYLWRT